MNCGCPTGKVKQSFCKDCYPNLCLVFTHRTAEDYIAPDGELRQIIGCCGEKEYLHGDILSQKDIDEIKRKLR